MRIGRGFDGVVATAQEGSGWAYFNVTDAHAIVVGIWVVAGTEWRRTHLRVLLKRGRQWLR